MTHSLTRLMTVLLLVLLAACHSKTSSQQSDKSTSSSGSLASGKSSFSFSHWQGPKLRVWSYKPADSGADTPIVFVMHGNNRDGDRYRDEWSALAQENKFILIVPEFSKEDFPGSNGYNLGYVLSAKGGEVRPAEHWSFSAIEHLFDEVRQRTGSQVSSYSMYGHSAGAQFVHRFIYFVPNARLDQAVAANAGWYTLPVLDENYPYGLGATGMTDDGLMQALSVPLVVLLGTADNDPNHASLRTTPKAMEQGAHRYARGQNFFRIGQQQAAAKNAGFSWKLQFAEGVGHKNGQMAAFAAPFLGVSEAD